MTVGKLRLCDCVVRVNGIFWWKRELNGIMESSGLILSNSEKFRKLLKEYSVACSETKGASSID